MTEAEMPHLRHRHCILDGTGAQEERMNSTQHSQESVVRHSDITRRVSLVDCKCIFVFHKL